MDRKGSVLEQIRVRDWNSVDLDRPIAATDLIGDGEGLVPVESREARALRSVDQVVDGDG